MRMRASRLNIRLEELSTMQVVGTMIKLCNFIYLATCVLPASSFYPATKLIRFQKEAQPHIPWHTSQGTATTVRWLSSSQTTNSDPLCDLQTFLKLTDMVQSGGEAKVLIQEGMIELNGEVETRRAKKLFAGDTVSFMTEGNNEASHLDVSSEVSMKGYIYKRKVKKVKPVAAMDEDGNLEFRGRFRSEVWRTERKTKKLERKKQNKIARDDTIDG